MESCWFLLCSSLLQLCLAHFLCGLSGCTKVSHSHSCRLLYLGSSTCLTDDRKRSFRFGDTAANAGVFALLEKHEQTRQWPVVIKTLCASGQLIYLSTSEQHDGLGIDLCVVCFAYGKCTGAAVVWRLGLMPLDTAKTMMQVRVL